MVSNDYTDNMYMVMDESEAPYKDGECPAERTLKDDLFDIKLAIKHKTKFKPDSDIAVLMKKLKQYNIKITQDTDLSELTEQIKALGLV